MTEQEKAFREALALNPSDYATRLAYGDWLAEQGDRRATAVKADHFVRFVAAFDKRHPDPSKNGGIHGVEARWYVKGREGAVQFVVYTNWHLPHVQAELLGRVAGDARALFCPMAADVGYHSPTPRYEDQPLMDDACDLLDGRPCYYDGSSLQAEELLEVLLRHGDAALWEALEARYTELFTPEGTPRA